jgi:pimeloyl-ACP methyl ester carboxylesterase
MPTTHGPTYGHCVERDAIVTRMNHDGDRLREGRQMATQAQVHIAYDDVGTGDPAIVFVHGLFANRTYYATQVRHIAQRHRVVNIDLRGHGESDIPTEGYSLDILADDVARACDEAGVRRAVLCGHSMAVALRVATRRPDLAAGVVLLDGTVLIRPEPLRGLVALGPALDTDAWHDAALAYFMRVAAGAADRVRADISRAPRCYPAPLIRDIADSNATGSDARELASLTCPLMYVHGTMPTDLERLRQLQPDAIVEAIPNAGHWVMLTAPAEVNALLDRFLEVIA